MNLRDVYSSIATTRQMIRDFRSRATWVTVTSYIASISLCLIFMTAVVQAALTTLYAHGAHVKVERIWNGLAQLELYGLIWAFVSVLPLPKTFPGPGESNALWILALAFYMGFMLFCAGLKGYSAKLRKNANKAEDALRLQEPLLIQMAKMADASGQRIANKGDNNNLSNNITTILHDGEKQSLFWKIIVPIGIAVAATMIAHAMHLT
jgi:hypothetical protein